MRQMQGWGLMSGLMAAALLYPPPPAVVNEAPAPRRFRRTTLHKPNGTREVQRRSRQIERGQLTAANGLVE
jgi:hypothetical protein